MDCRQVYLAADIRLCPCLKVALFERESDSKIPCRVAFRTKFARGRYNEVSSFYNCAATQMPTEKVNLYTELHGGR